MSQVKMSDVTIVTEGDGNNVKVRIAAPKNEADAKKRAKEWFEYNFKGTKISDMIVEDADAVEVFEGETAE